MTLRDYLIEMFDFPLLDRLDAGYSLDRDELMKLARAVDVSMFSKQLKDAKLMCSS